jgi:hypothetical protein
VRAAFAARPGETGPSAAPAPPVPQAVPPDLAAIAALATDGDRREALHRLGLWMLDRAALLTGTRPGRSATAREALSALPRDWRHHAALREAVAAAELAWFGGRPVADAALAGALASARALEGERPPP